MPSIQLVNGTTEHDIDLIVVVLDEMDAPFFTDKPKNVCFYNNTIVSEPKRKIGEDDIRIIASLTDDSIHWDQRYRVSLAISCYNMTLDGWDGFVRLVDDSNNELATFTMDEIGDLSRSRCVHIAISKEARYESYGFLGLRQRSRFDLVSSITKYMSTDQYLLEYGVTTHKSI